MPTIAVRLDAAREKKLARMARWRGKSKSATIREILDTRIETGADILKKLEVDKWESLLPDPRRRRGSAKTRLC